LFQAGDGSFSTTPAEAPPLGVVAGMEFPSTRLSIKGGTLYLYSDGVTEARTPQGDWLQLAGLQRLLGALDDGTPAARLAALVAEIASPSGEQHDDITLMLIDGSK
jgi:sigma-B regulation protein RsbU (phosphoserine phosphatase)